MKRIDELRPWQAEAFQLLRPAQYGVCQAPGGSGKSLEELLLAQADIDDTGNKQLILVPQNHIHHSFFGDENLEFTLPGNNRRSLWSVAQNLCDKRPETGKRLREFLLEDVRTLRKEGRHTAISTHRAMVTIWQRLSVDEKRRAIQNISFRIDEAHHISNVFHEDELELYNRKDRQTIIDDATKLGNIVRYILRADEPTVKLHLTTATFFRGDRKTIISKAFREQFAHYYLAWDEYYDTLGIQELQFDFLEYDKNPVAMVLEAVRKEQGEHHLIIIPALTTRYRTAETHSILLKGLQELYSGQEVLDLVAPATQERNKALLYAHPDTFRVVVACRLFDEGTDWVPCNRLHNTDAGESSLTQAVQRFFRPLRKHPAKKTVIIRNYITRFSPELEMGEQRKILSNRFNAVLACIVTQGELMPTIIPLTTEETSTPRKRLSLQEAFGDEYCSVMEGLLRGCETVEDKTDAAAIQEMVDKVIEQHGQPEGVEREGLRNAMLVQVARIVCPPNRESNKRTLEPGAIDGDTIRLQGFDKVWEKLSPIKSTLCWGTDNITSQTIREFLAVVHEIPTLDEIKAAITKYHTRTGKRPFNSAGWFEELDMNAMAVNAICRRHYGLWLSQVVNQVLGDPNDGLVEKTREIIREYWSRGIRLKFGYGYIPEIGLNAYALDARLKRRHSTSIAAELAKILGPATDPFTMEKVRDVIRNYLKKETRIHPAYGLIPELNMTSQDVEERLQQSFKVTLDELVDDVRRRMRCNFSPIPSLEQIHTGIRDFHQATGQRPKLGMKGSICGRNFKRVDDICHAYHNTSLRKEMTSVLGDPNDGWLDRLHTVIREYWSRGVRIKLLFGTIPELGLDSQSVNNRLREHYDSTLFKEVAKVLGDPTDGLLEKFHMVMRTYYEKGQRITVDSGYIPELGMKSSAINRWLARHHNSTLAKEFVKVFGNTSEGWLDKLHAVIRDYWKQGVRITCGLGSIPEMGMTSAGINSRLVHHYDSNLAKEFFAITGMQWNTNSGAHRSHVNGDTTGKEAATRSRRGLKNNGDMSSSHT